MKRLIMLIVLTLFVTDSIAGGRGSGSRGHTTARSSGGHHSSYGRDFSSSSFDDSGGNFSLPHINFIQQESHETEEFQSIVYDRGNIRCYVCKTSRTTSFQDIPCGYYAINHE